ncbi:DUF3530 family protein [Aliikangiella maris]|uniref:DUF3530 family protein n=2 Tax=Aliikangiella maris TaxID=3162458 RepID=A0ABV3MT06_9GAMM
MFCPNVQIKRLLLFLHKSFLILYLSSLSNTLYAAETADNESNNMAALDSLPKQPSFSVNQNELARTTKADDQFWIDIEQTKILVLKHWMKTKKKTGNLILLHTNGENAEHLRLVYPLAHQFSQQGWEVYIPNLPLADYPSRALIKSAQPNQTDTDNSEEDPATQNTSKNSVSTANNLVNKNTSLENKQTLNDSPNTSTNQMASLEQNKPFFNNQEAYQEFYSLLMQNLLQKIPNENKSLLIVANENSAFWILASLPSLNQVTQISLFHPETPQNLSTDLQTQLSKQTLPYYIFIQDESKSAKFIRSLNQGLWKSEYSRIAHLPYTTSKLEIENITFSKMITGWVKSQKKE